MSDFKVAVEKGNRRKVIGPTYKAEAISAKEAFHVTTVSEEAGHSRRVAFGMWTCDSQVFDIDMFGDGTEKGHFLYITKEDALAVIDGLMRAVIDLDDQENYT